MALLKMVASAEGADNRQVAHKECLKLCGYEENKLRNFACNFPFGENNRESWARVHTPFC